MEKLESHEIEEFHFLALKSPGIQLSVLGIYRKYDDRLDTVDIKARTM